MVWKKYFFCIGNVFFVFPKKSVSSGHKPALVPDKWIFFCKASISYTGNDSRFPISVRYSKLVYMKVTNWCWHWYVDGLEEIFFLLRLFFAWYFKCPELTQPNFDDSSKNLKAYQKSIVGYNLAQIYILTGIHCFVL